MSSSKERIEQAKNEWKTGRFDIVPGDEEEFIPLAGKIASAPACLVIAHLLLPGAGLSPGRHDRRQAAVPVNSPPETPLLDKVRIPADSACASRSELPQLAAELRAELIDAVSITGGHLGAGLGVVELTVALHYVFNTPDDRLIWDVGHQAYPHKILTGRRDRIRTLRQEGGLSGFTKRTESEYDPFGAAHSSTSISAGLGMAVARDLQGGRNNVVAVIGDGAMSAGMAYEAMNNAGALDARLIVVLNDNDMSIAPPTGAMSAYLARLASGRTYLGLRDIGKKLTSYLGNAPTAPSPARSSTRAAIVTGGTLFEELGFYHIGPIDGHNLEHLIPVLKNVRDNGDGPVLIHVVTQKGKGYRAGRGRERQISRRQQVRRDHRRAGQAAGQRAGLHARCSPTA